MGAVFLDPWPSPQAQLVDGGQRPRHPLQRRATDDGRGLWALGDGLCRLCATRGLDS